MTAAIETYDVTAAAADSRKEYAADIRKFMETTPGIWDFHEERPFLDALILLSHLDEAGAGSAIWAHRQVHAEARARLETWGWVDGWLGNPLFELNHYLNATGYEYKSGEWVQVGLDKWIPFR